MHLKYRPDIDGLRTVAVLSVIGFHAFPLWVPGGFIGVDIFFVISGFLISTIIFGNLDQNTFSIVDFYNRRIRRVLPALLLVLLSVLIFGYFVLVTDEYKQLGKHLISSALFAQNFVLWKESGYFDTSATTKPLLHLWSLAVEEQFYIFWPLLLAFLWKRRLSLAGTTIAVALISFVINIITIKIDPSADYFLPFSRFWELMVGGILANLYLHHSHFLNRYKEAQSALGAILIALALILIRDERNFPGWWALLPTLGAFFLISAGPLAFINKKILSNKLIVHVGLISYPLYLWHWPLLSFGFIVKPNLPWNYKIGLIIIAIILAELTYWFIEIPLRAKRNDIRVPIYLLSGLCFFPLFGIIISLGYSTARLDHIHMAMKDEWDFLKSQHVEADDNATGIYPFHLEKRDVTMFIGDSEVAQYAQRLSFVQDRDRDATGMVFVVGGACIPIKNVYTDDPKRRGCQKNLAAGLQLAKRPNIQRIVIGGSWNSYFRNPGYYFKGETGHIPLEKKSGQDQALANLSLMIAGFKADHKQVYLLLGNPISSAFDPHVHVPRFTASHPLQDSPYGNIDKKQLEIRDNLLHLAARNGIQVIDPFLYLCNADKCRWIMDNGTPIFKDNSHFNPAWAINHANFIDRTIQPTAK